MDEEIKDENNDRAIYYKIETDEKVDTVTLVKLKMIYPSALKLR